MELDPVQVAGDVHESGERRGVGLSRGVEALRQASDRIAVAHPDRLMQLEAGEQPVIAGERQRRWPILALGCGKDVPTELLGHQLGAVADPEHGDAAGPDRRIRPGGVVVVHGVRAAGQDDRAHPAALQFLQRGVVRQQLRVHVQLADAAGDELGKLAAEVENGDGPGRGGGAFVGGSTLGRGRVERGLQVGLDLGVIGGQDAMPGVGRLAVDRLAPGRHARVHLMAAWSSQCSGEAAPSDRSNVPIRLSYGLSTWFSRPRQRARDGSVLSRGPGRGRDREDATPQKGSVHRC